MPAVILLVCAAAVSADRSFAQSAPAKPTGLSTEDGNTQVRLRWSGPSDPTITHWQYAYQPSAGSYTVWADMTGSGSATRRYTVTGLANNRTYKFKIRAVNAAGPGRESDEATGEPYPAFPEKPAGFQALSGDRRAVLIWDHPDDVSIQGWEFRRKKADERYGSWAAIPGSDADTTTHTVLGLENGTGYVFQIQAFNGAGTGRRSDEKPVTPMPTVPEKPTGFSVEAGNRKAVLTWADPGNETISEWQYAYRTTGEYGGWTDMAGSSAATVRHVVSMLENNISHTFRIRAVNDIGAGAGSDEVSATPMARAPEKPAGLAALAGDGQVTLSWDDPSDASIEKWQYAYRTTGGYGSWTDIAGSGAMTTRHVVSDLPNGTTHRFKIRAVNDVGPGVESEEASSTPLSRPAKPSGFTVKAGDARVALAWNDPLNSTITGWQYSFRTSGGYGAWTDIEGSDAATTGHTVTGLSNGVGHTFKIRAVNAGGNGAESDAVAAMPQPVPEKPSGLRAEAGNTQARLFWTDPGDDSISGWQYRSRTTAAYGAWKDIPGSGPSTVRHTVAGLANDTAHTFRIRALNASGAGAESDEAAATPREAVPAKPTGFRAEPGDGEVLLAWNDPDDASIRGWQFKSRKSGGSYKAQWDEIPGSDARTVQHTVTGLENGATYVFKIRTVNAANGPESEERSAMPRSPRPAAPTGLSARAGDARVGLSWDDPADPAITGWQYAVRTRGAFGEWTDIPGSDAATAGYTATGLENGVRHVFKLRAVNEHGGGAESDEVAATPLAVPAKPTGFTATPGDGRVLLQWTDPDDATITGWQYRYRTTGGYGGWTGIDGSGAKTAGHTVTKLANDVVHRFEVRAVNRSGPGAPSGEATATPLAVPAKPAGLSATPGAGEAVLEWNDPMDPSITGWEYNQRRLDGEYEEEWTNILGSAAATMSHKVTGLGTGFSYGFKVRALNMSGTGAESDEAVAALPPVPVRPEGFAATPGDRTVALAWDDPGDATITGWQYRYRTTGSYGDWTDIPGGGAATTGYTVAGLAAGIPHHFRVRAVNSSGSGLESDETEATPFAVPAKPTGLTATSGSGEVLLEWDDPGDGAITGWEYNRRQGDGEFEQDWTFIAGSAATTTSHTVIGLMAGSSYTFKVRAVAGDRAGAESDVATATVPLPPLPARPEELVGEPGVNEVSLDWKALGDPSVTLWQYRYRTTGEFGDWTDIPGSHAGTTGHTITGLEGGTPHTFRVRAVNSSGYSLESAGVTVVPLPGLARPTGLKAHAGYGQVVLTWEDPKHPAIVKWQHVARSRADTGADRWIDISGSSRETTRHVVARGWENDVEAALKGNVEYVFRVRYCTRNDCLFPNRSPGSDLVSATPRAAAKPAERRTVKAVMAGLAGHVAAGAEIVIGERFSAGPDAARVVLAGRELPLFAPARNEEVQPPAADGRQAMTVGMDAREALRKSAFRIPLGAPAGGRLPQWSLWHRGELRRFGGAAGPGARFGGRLLSTWFGLDMRLGGRWLFGAALARSEGELEYGADAVSGAIETVVDSVHPFLQRHFEDGGMAWMTLGGGRGTIRNETAGRGVETADAELATVSAGFRSPLPMSGALKLSVSGAGGLARLAADGDARTAIGSLSASTDRQSLGIEAALEEGEAVYYTSLSLRRDGGDGVRGLGLELSSGLTSPLPASSGRADIRSRSLVWRSGREYRELGLTVTVRQPADANRGGPSWSVAGAYGAPAGGRGEPEPLWSREAPKRGGGKALPTLDLKAGWRFVSHRSLFEPHAALGLAGVDVRRLALGVDIGPLAGPVLKLAAERRAPQAGGPESRISAALQFRF